MTALGLALVGVVAVTWGTGLLYLMARAGLPSPVRLAFVDAVHIYTGIAGLAILLAKVWRVGWRRRVEGAREVTVWQRGVSASIPVLYAAVFLTGVAAVLPLSAAAKGGFVQAHLMTSVWAALPTSLHLVHHRARWAAHLRRYPLRPRRRHVAVVAVTLLPLLAILARPVAAAPITEVGGGGAWSPAGLQGIALGELALSPDGSTLAAAGDGVYVQRVGTGRWRHLDLETGAEGAHPNIDGVSAAGHAAHLLPPGSTLGLTAAAGPAALYAGAAGGLYWAPRWEGPLTRDPLPAGAVRAIAVDPENPYARWAATSSGVWFAWVFGHGWTQESRGLPDPGRITSLAFLGEDLFAGGPDGVYRWNGTVAAWVRAIAMPGLVVVSAGRSILAAGGGGQIRVLDRRGWHRAAPVLGHQHPGGELHSALVSVVGDRMVASGSEGVLMSLDEGRTWSPLPRPPAPALQFAIAGGRLVAATSDGVYAYPVERAPQDGPLWWFLVVAAGLAAGAAVVAAQARPRRRWKAR